MHAMPLKEFTSDYKNTSNPKLKGKVEQFEKLLADLNKREIPEEVAVVINTEIEKLNQFKGDEKAFKKQLFKSQAAVYRMVQKKLKLVPKNYYRMLWMSLGMTSFGLPIGIAFGLANDNMALLGAFLPVGMVIGMAIGAGMDKKAAKDGLQLDV